MVPLDKIQCWSTPPEGERMTPSSPTSASGDLISGSGSSQIPLFDIRAERDQLATQLVASLKRNEELNTSLLNMATAFNSMEERIISAEKDLESHSVAITNMQRRLHRENHSSMPGYVETLIINPDPTKMLKIVRAGDIFQLAKHELIFADSLLMMTFRISTIILDILRYGYFYPPSSPSISGFIQPTSWMTPYLAT